MRFVKDQPVTVRRLGPNTPGDYRAIIKGISVLNSEIPGPFSPANVWILEMVDRLPNQRFDYVTMVEACIDEMKDENASL